MVVLGRGEIVLAELGKPLDVEAVLGNGAALLGDIGLALQPGVAGVGRPVAGTYGRGDEAWLDAVAGGADHPRPEGG